MIRIWGVQDTAAQAAVPLTFHAARLMSYAVLGALVASGFGALGLVASLAPWVRPLWALAHAATAVLGLWLLIMGRQPAWMSHIGTRRIGAISAPGPARDEGSARPGRTPWGALAVGGLWVAWPCGLLQSALVVAALGNTAWVGALAMATFAVITASALQLAPWALNRWSHLQSARAQVAAVRLAGAMIIAGSGYSLGHDVWGRVAQLCGW